MLDVFNKSYNFRSDLKNPIMDKIIELIKNNPGNNFIVVVPNLKKDIKGVKEILFEEFGENDILVTSWTNLNEDVDNLFKK